VIHTTRHTLHSHLPYPMVQVCSMDNILFQAKWGYTRVQLLPSSSTGSWPKHSDISQWCYFGCFY